MTLRFSDTSLDPYLRFFAPKLSPFTTAVADGTIRVVGELADIDHLLVGRDGRAAAAEAVRLRRRQRRADRAVAEPARRRGRSASVWPARAPRSRWAATSACTRAADRARRVGRRQPRHPAGVLPRPSAAAGTAALHAQVSGPLDESGVLRQRARSPTDASATCRCRTASQDDQRAISRSTRRASASRIDRARWAAVRSCSAGGSASSGFVLGGSST